VAMIFISMPFARVVRLRPMRPRPTIPRVLCLTGIRVLLIDQPPDRSVLLAVTSALAVASINAIACSATDSWFAVGVIVSTTPASVAAPTSTLSYPTPCRAMTRRSGSDLITSAVYRSPEAMVAEAPLRISIVSRSLFPPRTKAPSSISRTSKPASRRMAAPGPLRSALPSVLIWTKGICGLLQAECAGRIAHRVRTLASSFKLS
jgi:hypothetical protein